MQVEEHPVSKFGGRTRVRVSGLYVEDDAILLVKHAYPNQKGYFWSPPGGELEFGLDLKNNLEREFKEEVKVSIEVGEFLFVNEFMHLPLHAVELFFKVSKIYGTIQLGKDPELSKEDQIIEDVSMMTLSEIKTEDKENIHSILWDIDSIEQIFAKNGYIKDLRG
ncbi:MAG: NUDIX domain-containing protein [Cyclobacteriaceae bacterium]|nr:NUDIX hydrolase [Cyclobacteriaceae bacterium]MCH8516711.1 NUDIX domain-containing protein [Cyclobacteriaceae bacterium]